MHGSEMILAGGGATGLTALANGTFLIAWNGSGNAPTAQIYNFDGTKRGAPIQLAPGSAGETLNFTATTLSDGRFVAVWQRKGDKDGVYARIFDVDGRPAGEAFKIGSGAAAQVLPQVAALSDGGFVVASVNDGAATIVAVGADGSQAAPYPFQDNALSIGLARLKNGNLVAFVDIGAPGNYDMVAYVFAADGSVHPAGEIFGDISDDPLSPHGAGLSDGGSIVVWDGNEGGSDAILLHRFLSDGHVSESAAAFIAGPGQTLGAPVVKALPGGGFVFAFAKEDAGGNDIYAGISTTNDWLSLNAETVGYDFSIGDQAAPEITILNDGRYVISWQNTVDGVTETRAEIFDPRTAAVHWSGGALGEQYQGTIYGDTLGGGGGNDLILGDGGADILNGGSGQDTLNGGDGNDTYYVASSGDQVVEASTGGAADQVYSSVSHALAKHVERLYASGSGSISLTGNTLANTITGNGGANKINGGLGKDVLKGGAGKDIFIFNTKASSSNVDKILDYAVKDDTIQLDNAIFKKLGSGSAGSPKKLSSKFFVTGTKAKDKNDYLVYNKNTGALSYDADGSGSGKAVLIATLSKNLKMAYSEFYVI